MLAWILGVTILQTDLLAQYTGVGQHESATVTLSQLQDYDIINQIKFRSLRSTAGGSTVRRVAFSTRYNSWDLRLTRAESFISPDFSVTLLNQKGARKLTLGIDHLWHYTGDVYGQNESHVSAFFDEITHSFSARIFVGSKVYFMEPIRTYGEDHDNDSLVFYDLKDIKPPLINNTSVCDSGSLVNDSSAFSAGGSSFSKSSERKRRSGILQDKKLCRLSFIADYTFFTNVGSRSSPKTTRLIISLFYRINSLFQATKFLVDEADEQSGYGFLLGDIIIHESWNNELGHYNARSDANGKPWTPRSLSTAFSYAQFNRTCLAHLLTYRPFMGVLGRAWTAAPELGGICSPSRTERGEEFKTNTGWTTYADYSGRRLLNAMAELITAHELGHNWGAAHDPDTEECSPPAHSRGKYLMYAHSVAGFAVNNYRFSPCSRRTIGATLAARAPLCFVATSESTVRLCGNRRLDPGEECDAGVVHDDICCTDNCKLRHGAQCSPWNHDCCTSACQVAPPSTQCSERHSGNPCLSPGTCDGKSASCPGPTRLSGVPCAEHGRCIQGKCRTQCERLGLHTCICDEAEQSCYICCLFPLANSNSYTCRPITIYSTNDTFDRSEGRYSFVPKTNQVLESVQSSGSSNQQVYLHLENYRPCATGYCMDGRCTRSPENSILRFWGFGADSKEYSFTSFLQNNLVVSVVTVSLLYIPSAYGIQVLRRRRRQRRKVDNFKVPFYTYELPSYPTQDETSSKGSRDTGIDSEMRASVDEAGGYNSSGPSEVAFHV
ncbi:hypothetical protein CRM22_005651 [Opisthorchis felineus]|uniref:Disintegrin domain-containing protein n=1 Tax=Opisthorchis felineus TaxID=147828 RepID=A0A4S2LQ48_OPIFE|nr:hypothetical protein CRM22_005651 [Opisthorchis felineus]